MAARGRLLVGALIAAGALAAPSFAIAAPAVTAVAVPSTPQDCQAGCIWSEQVACAAVDPSSVTTTVRCSILGHGSVSGTQSLPFAVATGKLTSSPLSGFTLCVEGTSTYRDGSTSSTGPRCADGDAGVAVVAAPSSGRARQAAVPPPPTDPIHYEPPRQCPDPPQPCDPTAPRITVDNTYPKRLIVWVKQLLP
jgi:hypothetical protein